MFALLVLMKSVWVYTCALGAPMRRELGCVQGHVNLPGAGWRVTGLSSPLRLAVIYQYLDFAEVGKVGVCDKS